MKISEDLRDYAASFMDTPLTAVCVKSRDPAGLLSRHQFGKLLLPVVLQGEVTGPQHLAAIVAEYGGTVKVRGHGWQGEVPFVWEGTAAEFNETWRID